jgi:1,4-alpha-glucan branching enzyme
LSEQKDLKYHFLLNFDKLMIGLDVKYSILGESFQYVRTTHEADQILIYERGGLLFVFNWNPTKSF